MHQQVRTSTKKAPSGSAGPGAMEAEGGLVDILEILLGAGVNLRAAGGRDLDRGGEFVFAVHHEENDDRPGEDAAALLRDEKYRARAVYVHHCLVDDEPGSLLRCIQETEATEGPVFEIFVGTANVDDHKIPIQITTRRGLGEEEQAAS
jgi:hypothetical protein